MRRHPYYAQSVYCDLAPGLSAPLSCLNSLRREALAALTSLLGKPAVKRVQSGIMKAPTHQTKAPAGFYARFADEGQLPPDLSAFACVYLPLHTPAPKLKALVQTGAPIAVEIPRGLFGREGAVRASLKAAKQAGVTTALAHTLDAVRMAREAGFLIHGGFGLNLFNTQALEQAASIGLSQATLSFELTLAPGVCARWRNAARSDRIWQHSAHAHPQLPHFQRQILPFMQKRWGFNRSEGRSFPGFLHGWMQRAIQLSPDLFGGSACRNSEDRFPTFVLYP